MSSTEWIAGNDLSLTFDTQGRLWRFRSTRPHGRPVGATLAGTDLVITVEAPGAKPGDYDVELTDGVLAIVTAGGAPTRVGLPKPVGLHALETAYGDDTFEVRVPLVPAAKVTTPEREVVPAAV